MKKDILIFFSVGVGYPPTRAGEPACRLPNGSQGRQVPAPTFKYTLINV